MWPHCWQIIDGFYLNKQGYYEAINTPILQMEFRHQKDPLLQDKGILWLSQKINPGLPSLRIQCSCRLSFVP